jgi:hypothetical protein
MNSSARSNSVLIGKHFEEILYFFTCLKLAGRPGLRVHLNCIVRWSYTGLVYHAGAVLDQSVGLTADC